MKLKIYNANNGVMEIGPDFEFEFDFTCTITTDPNEGTVRINGLSDSARQRLEEIANPYEGEERYKRLTFYDSKAGSFYRAHVYPKPARLKKGTEVKNEPVTYKLQGWGKCRIYDDSDTYIYSGDVLKIEHDRDTTTLYLGTAWYYMQMPYGQRLVEGVQDKSFWMARIIGTWSEDAPGITADSFSYMKIAENIAGALEDIDNTLYRETGLTISEEDFDRDNKGYMEAFEKLILEGDLNVTTPRYIGTYGKKETRPAYMLLSGKVGEVLTKLSNTGLFNIFCFNDQFYTFNYFKTQNPKGEIVYDTRMPAGVFPERTPVTDFVRTSDGRAVFNAPYGIMLLPGSGVEIRDRYAQTIHDVYIDTVECRGDSRGYTTTNSGRTNKFLWRER